MGNDLPTRKSVHYLAVAPGRVNLLGEHVDYNQGIVLPAAINHKIRVEAVPQGDRMVSLQALDLRESTTFHFDHLAEKKDLGGNPLPQWALYPAGVAQVLLSHGYRPEGIDATITSNVPIGSGLGSSAALEVAFATLWQGIGGWDMHPLERAQLCQQAENQYVGVNCGLMDQFACSCGVEGHALYFDVRSLEYHSIPLPANSVIIIADSRMGRSLARSAYNDRRVACEEAVKMLKTRMPHIQSLRDVTSAELHRHSNLLPELVFRRARHVVEEIERVLQALEYLNNGDAEGFGRLMLECHVSLRDLYDVSCPELDILVDIARKLPGCWGARLTGAGFGGCTVNLVAENKAEEFINHLKSGYHAATGRQAEVYLCRASQGAEVSIINL
jgi:galactokinase